MDDSTRGPVREAEGKVLLADISADELTADVRMRLAEDVLLWRAEGFRKLDGHDPRYGRVVPVADLDRAFGGPLTPPAPPAATIWSDEVKERPALIAEAEARLEPRRRRPAPTSPCTAPTWGAYCAVRAACPGVRPSAS
ncbi:hypothetical protein SFUMM280S_02025 [Streptomyces fumanus]